VRQNRTSICAEREVAGVAVGVVGVVGTAVEIGVEADFEAGAEIVRALREMLREG
jgi:hypothetical protein